MKNSILLTAILFFLISCGTNETKVSDELESPDVEVSNSKGNDSSPCQLISESAIKEILGIPEDAATKMEDVMRTYQTCFYEWETVTYPRIMMMGGNEVRYDIPAEISIVMVKNATETMFETSSVIYKEGQVQNGIGDRAIWGDKMSQLTFLAKGTMIHLHVKKSADAAENKEFALKIAEVIIGNL